MKLLLGLVCSRDGSISLTKLAAATAHLFMAATFFRLQLMPGREFNDVLWMVYGGFAIAHAAYDKTAAMLKDYKSGKAEG